MPSRSHNRNTRWQTWESVTGALLAVAIVALFVICVIELRSPGALARATTFTIAGVVTLVALLVAIRMRHPLPAMLVAATLGIFWAVFNNL